MTCHPAARNRTKPSAASGDFAGLIDVGGRKISLECRGEGRPTVILEAGVGDRADVWSRELDQPDLAIAAIRQVVDAVRDPQTWTTSAATPAS